jgi:hypothetical protein
MAAEQIEPTLELSAVLVEVTWVADKLELAEIRRRYESPLQRSWASFVERPTVVNDERTLQLGHELVHCLLGAYHSFL